MLRLCSNRICSKRLPVVCLHTLWRINIFIFFYISLFCTATRILLYLKEVLKNQKLVIVTAICMIRVSFFSFFTHSIPRYSINRQLLNGVFVTFKIIELVWRKSHFINKSKARLIYYIILNSTETPSVICMRTVQYFDFGQSHECAHALYASCIHVLS